jgi:hypothetical protein
VNNALLLFIYLFTYGLFDNNVTKLSLLTSKCVWINGKGIVKNITEIVQ